MLTRYKRLGRFASPEANWAPRSVRQFTRAFLFLVLPTLLATPPTVSADVLAYIPQPAANQVTIFDTDAGTVVTQVPVGGGPLGVAVDVAMQTVYVTNSADGTVSVIDMGTQKVIYTVKVGNSPIGVAVTPDGSTVYVANAADNTLSWFPAQTETLGGPSPVVVPVGTISGVGAEPYGVAASTDGSSIYVTLKNGNNIATISTATNTITSTSLLTAPLPSGITETRIAFPKKGCEDTNCARLMQPLLLAADAGTSLVSAFDDNSNQTFPPIPVGSGPTTVGTFPFIGSAAYVANTGAQSLTSILPQEIETAGVLNYTTANIPLPADPNGVSGTPDGQFLWTVNTDGTMSQVNPTSNTVVQSVPIGMPGLGLGQFIAPRFGASDLLPLLKGTADLSVTVDSTGSVLTVANAGPNTAKAVQLTVSVPKPGKFVTVEVGQGGCATPAYNSSGQIKCNLGELAAGENTTVEIVLDGDLTDSNDKATVADAFNKDPNSANNTVYFNSNIIIIPSVGVAGPQPATDFQLEQTSGALKITPYLSNSIWNLNNRPLYMTVTLPVNTSMDRTVAPEMGCVVQEVPETIGGIESTFDVVTCPTVVSSPGCSGIVTGLCSVEEITKYDLLENRALPAQFLVPVVLDPGDPTAINGTILADPVTVTVTDNSSHVHSTTTTLGTLALVTNPKDLGWLKLPSHHSCHDPTGVTLFALLGGCNDSPAIKLAQTILVAAAAAVVGILAGPIIGGGVGEALASNEATQFLVITSGDIIPDGLISSEGAVAY